jgi:hypothetical protein
MIHLCITLLIFIIQLKCLQSPATANPTRSLNYWLLGVFDLIFFHSKCHIIVLIFEVLMFFFTLFFQTFIYPSWVLEVILLILDFIFAFLLVSSFTFVLIYLYIKKDDLPYHGKSKLWNLANNIWFSGKII